MSLYQTALALTLSAFAASTATAAFIAPLDGTSTASTFEVGAATNLPNLGWTNVSGAARMFDGTGLNGSIIHATDSRGNYEVQYTTATSIVPSSRYTLSLQMGFVGGTPGSVASANYSFQLGTVDGSDIFTPIGSPKTGTAAYGNNMSGAGSTWIPLTDTLVLDTGAVVSGDLLAVRWAQTSRDTDGVPWFGFDNVRLEVESAPVPEPTALLLVPAGALLFCSRRHRRTTDIR